VTLNYNGADFFSAAPQLTAASYDGLDGLNTNEGYTFSYDPFTPTGGNYASIFFTIYNATTGAVAYNQTFIGDDVSSITVPAGTLQPGAAYYDELIFSTRIQTTDPDSIDCTSSPPGQCPGLTELAWDSRTVADFTTETAAVPEPSTWAMMLVGFAGLGFVGYRGLRRTAARAG
jgi:PEP-CTERM motif